MRLALLFSGQGGQGAAHWQQVATGSGPLRQAAAAYLPGLDATDAPSDPEFLARNRIAQPLIFTQQMLLWLRLQRDLPRPVCAAGYSLGEVAACAAAGAFSPEEGVGLCAERARLMDEAAPGEFGMLAVLGLPDAEVEALAHAGGLAVAIRNAPRHLVVAGPRAGISKVAADFEAAGASRLVHLAVRTPSHTPLLSAAASGFKQLLDSLPETRLAFPVFSAIDARAARSSGAALDALARQISSPLDWAACLEAVLEMQPDAVLEIGPGNAMSRLFAELAPAIPVRACDDFRSPEGIVDWVRAGD